MISDYFGQQCLENLHKKAFHAHEAANCAREQDKYWEMHQRIFMTRKMTEADLIKHAQSAGLYINKFKECLGSGRYAAEIRKDIGEGRKAVLQEPPRSL